MMLLENGFSSPRAADSFPAGLKVLVVDDDPTWLKILEKMLKKCSYEVTTCGLAREALRLLRERKDGFDIIISDVNMPDMDGFKLLEHVGLEMDLPVIMMSVDGETSRVMKGVQHGACDYLLKPIRMKELKNIWQHVLRKRMHDIRDIESHDNLDDDDLHLFRYAADLSDGGHFLTCADQTFLKKRKDIDSKHGDKDSTDPSAKRPRVVWSVDLHQKFVKAVNQIGFDKVGPKKILDLMNVPRLTRENVASHLQKYRLYLSRLEKENDLKSSCGGLKNSDEFPKDFGGGFGIQNTTAMQQSMAGVVSFSSPDYKPPAQSIDTKPHEIGPKGINLWPLVEPGNPFTGHISDVHKATCSPKMGLDNSIGSPKPKFGFAALDSPLASQFTLSREVQDSPSELEYKPHQQLLEMPFVNECKALNQLQDCFYNHTTVVSQQHDLQQPDTCLSPRISVSERDSVGTIDSKLLSAEIHNNIIEQPLLIRQPTGSLSHSKSCAANLDIFGLITNSSIDISQNAIQNGLPGFELEPRNHISGSESAFGPSTDDLGGLYLFQGDNFATASTGFDNIEYSFPDLSNEALSFCLNGLPRFNSEYFGDSTEYAVVDQGLFIS